MKDCIRLQGGALVAPDGAVYFRQVAEWFEVKAQSLGPDHFEASAKRPAYYVEGTEEELTDFQRRQLEAIRSGRYPEPTEAEKAAQRALSCRVAANRAKTKVRKLCKTMGADSMLTLTYRANQTDLALCKQHVKAFVRRCRRFWPAFTAVAAFEEQSRGAWHVHMAMAHVPTWFLVRNGAGVPTRVRSYNVIRDAWRRTVGDLGGNIDVARKKRASKKTPAQIAAYLSKYMLKAFEAGVAYSNRYTRFGGAEPPKPELLGRYREVLQAMVDLYALTDADARVCTAVYSEFGDWFFMAAERSRSLVA